MANGDWVHHSSCCVSNCPYCQPRQYGHGAVIQHGCICPPGAEKTCQGTICPRRPLINTGAGA